MWNTGNVRANWLAWRKAPGSGLLPNPQNHPDSPRETGIEEAEIQENLGEFPDRLADQGEVKPTPVAEAAVAELAQKSQHKQITLR